MQYRQKRWILLKKLFVYLKGYTRQCVLGPLFKLLEASFELIIPLLVASIIDNGILLGDKAHIVKMVAIMALLGLTGLIAAVTAQYFAAKAAIGFSTRLRHALMNHIQTLSFTEIDQLGTSTLVTRMTSDVNQLQTGVNITLRLLLRSPIIVFGAMIMAFTIDTRLALTFVAAIPLLAIVVFGVMLGGIPLYKKVQGRLDRVTAITRENLSGVRPIRAFRKEEEQVSAFGEANRKQTSLQNRAGILTAVMNPVTYVIVNLATVILIREGAVSVEAGELTQGEVVALVNYMGQILVELVKLATSIFTVTKAVACGNRIGAVLDMPTGMAVTPAPDGTPAPASDTPAVVFHNVSMTYEGGGEPSLEGISFTAERGMTVGIIGGTGSGKSTLVNLIPRFYEATEGTVTVFGLPVESHDPATLRARIGVVPQKADLFKGTIRSNLCFGVENATDEELWNALETAQAADFVREKEGGLDAPVEQKGRNLSGGQKQRLTIARALVGSPEILILDDSASALDFATDARLRKALRELAGDPTVFIISQRTSSIKAADLIIVLDEGRAVGMGTHEELLTSCEVYREIHESQFKGGEAQ